jgi:hypothetical protein
LRVTAETGEPMHFRHDFMPLRVRPAVTSWQAIGAPVD